VSSMQSSCCKFSCLLLLLLPILISFVYRGVTETVNPADSRATPGPSSSHVDRPHIFLHTQGAIPCKVWYIFFHTSTPSNHPYPRIPFLKMNLTVTSTCLMSVILGNDLFTAASKVQCSLLPSRHIHPAPPMSTTKTSSMKKALKTTTTKLSIGTSFWNLSKATMRMIALSKMKVGNSASMTLSMADFCIFKMSTKVSL
jgi:hypothetical protein